MRSTRASIEYESLVFYRPHLLAVLFHSMPTSSDAKVVRINHVKTVRHDHELCSTYTTANRSCIRHQHAREPKAQMGIR